MEAVAGLFDIHGEMDKPDSKNLSKVSQNPEWGASRRVRNMIRTPRIFCIMDLPTEIRLKVLEILLVFAEENISVYSTKKGPSTKVGGSSSERLSVAVLQTCKRINEEGTPILYGRHTFTIYLHTLYKGQNSSWTKEFDAQSEQSEPPRGCAFFLQRLRWSTLNYITTMYFTSDSLLPSSRTGQGLPRAFFSCTGSSLLSRCATNSSNHENGILSLSNYVSVQVFYAELSACKKEVEFLMNPSEEYMAALADDPAT